MPSRDSEDTHQLRIAVLRVVPKGESSKSWRYKINGDRKQLLLATGSGGDQRIHPEEGFGGLFPIRIALALTDGTFEKSRKWNARAISVV